MSLREEIRKGKHDGFNREVYDEDINDIINKVLDAAIMAIMRREEHQTPVEAIQALKEGKG